jgi:hypothetical protein
MNDKIWPAIMKTRDAGQKEYAHNKENVFANFERISKLLEISREKVLLTYFLKHVDGIASYSKGHKSQREDVTGRITDCIVYLCLFWAMIEDSKSSNIFENENIIIKPKERIIDADTMDGMKIK